LSLHSRRSSLQPIVPAGPGTHEQSTIRRSISLLSLIIWRSRYLAWATNMHSSPVGMITKLWWVETDEANALAERIDGACVHDKISERLIGSAATATLVAATKNPRRISFCSDISQMQGYVALRMEVLSIVELRSLVADFVINVTASNASSIGTLEATASAQRVGRSRWDGARLPRASREYPSRAGSQHSDGLDKAVAIKGHAAVF
jgi:hypothetical protein